MNRVAPQLTPPRVNLGFADSPWAVRVMLSRAVAMNRVMFILGVLEDEDVDWLIDAGQRLGFTVPYPFCFLAAYGARSSTCKESTGGR